MSIIHSSLLLGAGAAAANGYQIERSLRFNSSDSVYLGRSVSSASNRRTWTFSCWLKKSGVDTSRRYILFSAYSSSGVYFTLEFTSNKLAVSDGASISSGLATSAVFRDPSAWYHIVLSVDTTQATASNRIRLYVNGTEQTLSGTQPAQNADLNINTAVAHRIGAIDAGGIFHVLDCYLAECYLIDGQQLTPSSFTEVSATTGQLIPKAYTGSFGTNGFRLKFADNSSNTATTLGKDTSGNGNNWTPNNLSVTAGAGNDSLVDTPTSYGTDDSLGGSVRGNYATLNPLNVQLGAGSLSNGNLDLTGPSGSSAYNYAGGTFGIDTSTSTGWYFEFTQTTYGQFASVALLDQSVSASSLNNLYIIGHSFANQTAGISYTNAGALGNYGTLTTGLTTWASSGDVIGVAIKDNKIWFAKNNTWISGSPTAGTSPSITLASTKYVTPAAIGINSSVLSLNAGQRSWAYTAPSGFKALCDTNLISTTITTSGSYTGNGTADGPFVYLNGVPTAMTVGGNAVTFGTHADKLANGFKIRTSSTTYNQNASSYSYSITSTGAAFKNARAQPNP